MPHERWKERIVMDPAIMGGKPVIAGTRITVEHILRELGTGMAVDELLSEYPELTREDVHAAQAFAAEWLAAEEIVPLERAG